MQLEDMSKKDLLEKINVLNRQIAELQTGRRVAEDDRSDSFLGDSQFQNVFATAPIGLILTNLEGRIINANRAAQEMLGYTAEEEGELNIIEFYADSNERENLLKILKKEDRVFEYQITIRQKKGTEKDVLLNVDFIDLDDEKALLTSIIDTSVCTSIQSELFRSEEEYHFLFTNAPIGITVTDAKGHLIAHNQALKEMLGYTEEELKILNVADTYVHKEDRNSMLEILEDTGHVRDFETVLQHKNGKIIPVLINVDQIDFKGKHETLLTSIRSITNLKKAEAELTKERDFISAVLDIAASLVMVLDSKGRIMQFNRACEETSGYLFSEVEGKFIYDVLTEDAVTAKKRLDELLGGDFPSTHRSLWRNKDGKVHLIDWTNTALLDSKGEIEYLIGTGIDISEQQKSEQSLYIANQQLLSWVSDLEKRTNNMHLLSELGEHLQSCQDTKEACSISSRYIQRMFQGSNGALYLINRDINLAEAVEMWGEESTMQKVFLPTDCWSIRRGRAHLVDDEHEGLICRHILGETSGQYLCVPMMINGEALGILYINHQTIQKEDQSDASFELQNDNEIRLITTLAEHIALSLSNIKLREELREQSIIDVLTGLYNRRYMQEALAREMIKATYEQKNVGIIIFDIDHFKEFNDTLGHDAGDTLLREMGVFIRSSLRDTDIPCRFGGDEFVIVLPGANIEQTKNRAEQLRQGVRALKVKHMGKSLNNCTISVGVAAFPMHGITQTALLKSSDIALYESKKNGRDQVTIAPILN